MKRICLLTSLPSVLRVILSVNLYQCRLNQGLCFYKSSVLQMFKSKRCSLSFPILIFFSMQTNVLPKPLHPQYMNSIGEMYFQPYFSSLCFRLEQCNIFGLCTLSRFDYQRTVYSRIKIFESLLVCITILDHCFNMVLYTGYILYPTHWTFMFSNGAYIKPISSFVFRVIHTKFIAQGCIPSSYLHFF